VEVLFSGSLLHIKYPFFDPPACGKLLRPPTSASFDVHVYGCLNCADDFHTYLLGMKITLSMSSNLFSRRLLEITLLSSTTFVLQSERFRLVLSKTLWSNY